MIADPGQLEQVIANLGVNARDAMPDGGTLTIATANVSGAGLARPSADGLPLGGPLVALSVSDTGIGMDDHVLAHLFEPFFTTKELGRGTGLGLATVYGIVRQSGGQIQVASRPGEGSTFTVYLPRAEAASGGTGTPATTEPPVPGGSETVLVVEDEDAVRHLVCRVLRAKGYRVLEAPHAEAALVLAGTMAEPIDLLVTDLVMPGIGGLRSPSGSRRPGRRCGCSSSPATRPRRSSATASWPTPARCSRSRSAPISSPARCVRCWQPLSEARALPPRGVTFPPHASLAARRHPARRARPHR